MCHDINPLGTTMHLKELDRQAARSSRVLQPASVFSASRPVAILWREHRAFSMAASATAAAALVAVLGLVG